MNKIRNTCLSVLMLPLMAHGQTQQSLQAQLVPAIVKKIDASTILIDGVLLPGVEQLFKELFTSDIKTVVVRSQGGATITGLDIAEIIYSEKINVVVRDYCISSCANYLFVAAHEKTVEENSFVAWHGGHSNAPYARCSESECMTSKDSSDQLLREQKLYARTGASIDLIMFSGWLVAGIATGEFDEIKVNGKAEKIPRATRIYSDWIPTKEVLEKLGVKNIKSFWHPGTDKGINEVMFKHGFKRSKAYIGDRYPL